MDLSGFNTGCRTCRDNLRSWFCINCGERYCDKHLLDPRHKHGIKGLSKAGQKHFKKMHSSKLKDTGPSRTEIQDTKISKSIVTEDAKVEEEPKALIKIPPDAVPSPGTVIRMDADGKGGTVNGKRVEPH